MVDWFFDSTIQSYAGYAWLIVALLLLLSEIGTPGLFYFLSFSVGACGAAVVAFLGANIYLQCLTAVVLAVLTFFVMRIYIKPHINQKHKTNLDALMRQEAIVIEVIEPHKPGRIKIKGEEWPAVTNPGCVLHKGTVVIVIGLEGNKLIVRNSI